VSDESFDKQDNVVSFGKKKNKKQKNLADILNDIDMGDVSGGMSTSIDETIFFDDVKLKEMNEKHAFITSYHGRPMVLCHIYDPITGQKKIDFRTPEHIIMQYSNQSAQSSDKVMDLGRFWIRNSGRREYETVIFDPDLPKEYNNCYNLWEGMAVKPIKGSWYRTKRHIWRILCNKNKVKFKYVMKWFAYLIQHPGSPAEVAIIFKGRQGAGKGFIFTQFVEMFGEHGLVLSNRKHITGQFNEHLRQCVFLFADEAYNPGDRDAEGILKSIITEKRLMVEAKYGKTETAKNCLHIGMASNEDWVVPASQDSRRFFINEVDNSYARGGVPEAIRQHYFRQLWTEMKNGGQAAMLYDLLQVDLKGWHPRDDLPDTEELTKQKIMSLSKAEKSFLSFIEEGTFPNEPTKDGVFAAKTSQIIDHIAMNYPDIKKVSTNALTTLFKKIGCGKLHRVDGSYWTFPPLKDIRLYWLRDKHDFRFDDLDRKWLYQRPQF